LTATQYKTLLAAARRVAADAEENRWEALVKAAAAKPVKSGK